MPLTQQQVEAGQAVYTRRTLRVYDFVVLAVSNRFIWKCPTPRLLQFYESHLSANHLDVGVGSGYFPDRCSFPSQSPRIALMDLNAEALQYAAARIQRYQPETYQRDILQPVTLPCDRFDSVAINYLLHCLPGNIESKSVVLEHLIQWMNPGAVLFGSTLLHDGVKHSWAARQLMQVYNRKGIFSNQSDRLDDLQAALEARFDNVQIEVIGAAALFSGQRC